MPAERTRSLVLILARDLASRLATPVFVIDGSGALVFFNEAAEAVLGRTYAETGELQAGEWSSAWSPTDASGAPIPLEELPLGIAFSQGRPAHREFRLHGADGIWREIEATAFPLVVRAGEVAGAIAVFWERREEPV